MVCKEHLINGISSAKAKDQESYQTKFVRKTQWIDSKRVLHPRHTSWKPKIWIRCAEWEIALIDVLYWSAKYEPNHNPSFSGIILIIMIAESMRPNNQQTNTLCTNLKLHICTCIQTKLSTRNALTTVLCGLLLLYHNTMGINRCKNTQDKLS